MESLLHQLDPVLDFVRPHLLPIIVSLPIPVRDFALSQLGPTCYTPIFEQLNLTSHPECTQLAISKAVGIAIVSLSVVVKVPQLLKLLSSGSARGISFTSYMLETVAYFITLAYNVRSGNPFSTFGEIAILAVQNVVIGLLVLYFRGKFNAASLYAAALAVGGYALFNEGLVDSDMMALAQAATIPLALMSKVPQIWTIVKEKSTGQLSAFAVFNYLFGSFARIFTTLAEVDDPIILYGFAGSAVLNVVLALQMLWYWNSGTKLGTGTKKEKKFYTQGKSPNKPRASAGRRKA